MIVTINIFDMVHKRISKKHQLYGIGVMSIKDYIIFRIINIKNRNEA